MKTKVPLILASIVIAIIPATIKAINPTAVAMTTDVTISGGTSYSFTVRYADDGEIDVSSLDSGDVRITGPGGFNVAATFVSVNINTNGTPRIATYSIVPPGGSWDFADNGTYNVVMQAFQVFDGQGNPVAPGNIGSFTVMTPPGSPTPTPTSQLGNISTRAFVQTGNNVMIGGFIVGGSGPKTVIIRAIGPELSAPPFNIPNALADPTLELHNGSGTLLASNNNWQTTIIGGIITANQVSAIQNGGHAPTQPSESAIIASLHPGNYTAIVRGVNNTVGVALVEVYDISSQASSILGNVSTRGFVQTGDNVMIGGFIVQGTGQKRVIVRAIGPELSAPPFNVPNALANPTLELHDSTHTLPIASNDNWQTTIIGGIITASQVSAIQNSGHAPTQVSESAIIATLPAGNYTVIVRGVNNTTGVALVEVYDLGPD